jgi:ribosomal protein S18 acetylase RimI-like enzyme
VIQSLTIRPATPADLSLLRAAIVELQEFEHSRHSTRLPGEPIADAYLHWMQHQAEAAGIILVAESKGHFVGFVAGWIEETANVAETSDYICVMAAFRGQGIAQRLLHQIERFFRATGVTRLRITALATNTSAQACYQRAYFVPYEVVYEKLIDMAQFPGL